MCAPLLFLSVAGCEVFEPVFAVPGTFIYHWRHPPGELARQMEDPNYPDKRREAINGLLTYDFAHQGVYVERYRQIAQYDADYTVRALAIRALNRCRDGKATPVFIKSLNDDNEIVRLEAAKALANIPDPAAATALIQHLQPRYATGRLVSRSGHSEPEQKEESKDVRIACADALKHYKTIDVARALAAELEQREFAVSWQSRLSLIAITKRDYFYSEAAWLTYFTGPEKPFG